MITGDQLDRLDGARAARKGVADGGVCPYSCVRLRSTDEKGTEAVVRKNTSTNY